MTLSRPSGSKLVGHWVAGRYVEKTAVTTSSLGFLGGNEIGQIQIQYEKECGPHYEAAVAQQRKSI